MQELKTISEKNLNEASFGEKLDILSKLGIKVYPSEDLRTIRIKCGINLDIENEKVSGDATQCRKIILAPPKVTFIKPACPLFSFTLARF